MYIRIEGKDFIYMEKLAYYGHYISFNLLQGDTYSYHEEIKLEKSFTQLTTLAFKRNNLHIYNNKINLLNLKYYVKIFN
jgi:hypothetical protein